MANFQRNSEFVHTACVKFRFVWRLVADQRNITTRPYYQLEGEFDTGLHLPGADRMATCQNTGNRSQQCTPYFTLLTSP